MAGQLHQQDLLSTTRDLLTALDRGSAALNMIAHTLENEFESRFGYSGVSMATRPWLVQEQHHNHSRLDV